MVGEFVIGINKTGKVIRISGAIILFGIIDGIIIINNGGIITITMEINGIIIITGNGIIIIIIGQMIGIVGNGICATSVMDKIANGNSSIG
jgi:hypothetical protein